MEFLNWLQNTAWASAIAENEFIYPTVLTAHAIGMALVVGIGLMVSLRVLFGLPRQISILALDQLVPVAWVGFALNFVSGVLLFAPQAAKISLSLMFQLKIAFVILAGFATWFTFAQTIDRETRRERPATVAARLWAVSTMSFWIAAIVSGRLIAYIK